MIPIQLTLKNFLSYREATLDFRGLHVACICGANGAGKSSLLEAIAWAVWGEGRAQTEDDVIHLGETEARVDFLFQCYDHIYRIIRTRYRNQVSTLEFQVQTPAGFRALTEKGVRATQHLILQHLKLDYDTFINSAYLRQGRADEFMLKRPSDRKQILADLLKLDQYDHLAEQAKEQARQLKAELGMLERTLEAIAAQLQQADALTLQQAELQHALAQIQQQQTQAIDRRHQLQTRQQQRRTGQQQLQLQQQQQQTLAQDCQRLQQDLTATQQQLQELEQTLAEAETIAAQYQQLQQLQAEEEAQTHKFQVHEQIRARQQQLQQQQTEQMHRLQNQQQQAQAQLEALYQQRQEIQQTLGKAPEIEVGLEHLRRARAALAQLDQLQLQAAPLLQRRQQIQTQIDRAQARLTARLEELNSLRQQLEAQQHKQPQLQQMALMVMQKVEHLEKRRAYQQQVREKGMERRTFLERLQQHQRDCERQLAAIDHKILMLQRQAEGHPIPLSELNASLEERLEDVLHPSGALEAEALETSAFPSTLATQNADQNAEFPPCPLCDRPLDEHHWNLVLQRHQAEKREILSQIWVIREQLAVSDREIQVLRQEYRDVEKELAQYSTVLQQQGQLQQQLQGAAEGQMRLQQVVTEQAELAQTLQQGSYAGELHAELRLLDERLQQLSYDDRNHALSRGEVDRWRWAEVKQAELRQAQKRQTQLNDRIPALEATLAALEQQLQMLQHSPLQQQINDLEKRLAELGYDLDQHTALRRTLRQMQRWQLRYQELLQAQQRYPQVQQKLRDLSQLWNLRSQTLQSLTQQMEALTRQLDQLPDPTLDLQALEQQQQQLQIQRDEHLAQLGRRQQQQQQLEVLKTQHVTLSTELETKRRQQRVYQELAQAFGKNGIQALMIENVLPQLEAEANQILARLSANQLHVQFVTQRSKRGTAQSRNATRLIDTLDILISDVQGTRPYETYSGGEAFRVNFAIRLALARLMAQRSGTALQLLIIDEGFGTQDDAGCDRLIGAINAIAADFACILTVTHIPHLKEAFQTRIEVVKTEQGSQLRVGL